MTAVVDRVMAATEGPAGRVARFAGASVAFLVVVQVLFSPPFSLVLFGITLGSLYGLIATGIVLIYRTNRIVNFAAAGLGAVPAVAVALLQVRQGLPYPLAIILVVVGGLGLGALVDIVVVRRFATAPRLILTIATIGVVQVLNLISVRISSALRGDGTQRADTPTPWRGFRIEDSRGAPIFTGDQLVAIFVVVALCGALIAFLRFTRMGIALRASAENGDRALLLGIPVRLVSTVAWSIAGLFAAVTIFLRVPLVGVPLDGTLGYNVLLFVLTAAVVAKLDNIPVALVAGMAIGILEQASVAKTGSNDLASAIMLILVLLALLAQRKSQARALDTGVSTWQAVREFRAIPVELRGLREVQIAKAVLLGVVLLAALAAPFVLSEGKISKLTLIPLTAIVGVSLVVLTGWAGQVSLGQFGIVGAAAGVAGGLAANNNADFFVALFAGVAAGVIIAVLVGIPAVRVQGLFLAVTTLAFAAAMEFYFLKKGYIVARTILPHGEAPRIDRPLLWGRIDLANDRTFYYLSLVALVVAVAIARSFRNSRSGRIVIAARDNQRAAPAYGINVTRTRLAAFAVSGAIASIAGVMFAYQQGSVDAGGYGVGQSIEVFLVTVIGGITSLPGAILGAVILKSVQFFVEPIFTGAALLFAGPVLLLSLILTPGGIAEGLYEARDKFLRRVAAKYDILVPSLVADRRVEEELRQAEEGIIQEAEHSVEETESFDVLERRIACPVCHVRLTVGEAAEHDHLQVPVAAGRDA